MKVETITRIQAKVRIDIVTTAVWNDFIGVNLVVFLFNFSYDL
jgi:hypothetical protein